MCTICEAKAASSDDVAVTKTTSRRGFLGSLAALPALTLPAVAMAKHHEPPKPGNVLTPDQALERLMQGNERYTQNAMNARGFEATRAALATGQNPFACVLSCADSRVSPEFCFDEERGDLFVTRVAGNYVNTPLLASLEYAVAVLNAPLIMVLGHTQCGAIGAAIDAEENNTGFPGHIQSITSALAPAVRKAKAGKPADMMDATTRENIRLNVAALQQSTPLLRQHVEQGKLKVVGGLYHLKTGKVEMLS